MTVPQAAQETGSGIEGVDEISWPLVGDLLSVQATATCHSLQINRSSLLSQAPRFKFAGTLPCGNGVSGSSLPYCNRVTGHGFPFDAVLRGALASRSNASHGEGFEENRQHPCLGFKFALQ